VRFWGSAPGVIAIDVDVYHGGDVTNQASTTTQHKGL
jgi:hypothetical protein